MVKFFIEDERHAEQVGEFASLADAVRELRRRAEIPWDSEPNVAPCQSWATCGRTYEVIEYEDGRDGGKQLRRMKALEISRDGVVWHEPFGHLSPDNAPPR